ncbi:MAG: serine/threonine protein kinase [Bryobacteraceae bacterium]|nr:serine/threonine protein kinase [Bryobacteraceae bacterium]
MGRMDRATWSRVSDLFNDALADPREIDRLLAGEAPDVRMAVERLLRHHPDHRQPRAVHNPSDLVAGRYRLISLLSASGNGEAWLALDERSNEQVVVKIPLVWAWTSADLQRRFESEYEVLSQLDHPHIVRGIDCGITSAGAPFLVTPFIDGVSLRELLQSGPVAGPVAARLVSQIAGAIDAAHRQGVVHRDVKPENIMIRLEGGEPSSAVLIDFGIAYFTELTHAGSTTTRLFGTTAYMAPEQLRGQPCPATDVYAVALVAYEMLTGRPLFDASTPVLLYEQQNSQLRKRLDASLNPAVVEVLQRALRVPPGERIYPTTAFASHLAIALERPPGYMVRRRAIVAAGAATVAALGGWSWTQRPLLASETSVRHRAGANFLAAGWRKAGEISTDVTIVDPAHTRLIGTKLITPTQGAYVYGLSERTQRACMDRSWRFSARLIPTTGYAGIAVCLRALRRRFAYTVGRNQDGSSFALLYLAYQPELRGIRTQVQLPPAPGLALAELRYDAATRRVSAYLDGRELAADYTGTTEFLDLPGLAVAFGEHDQRPGEAIFGDVEFDISG